MKLSFQAPYLSVTSFPDLELPLFTLITGVNGAGKTHLLEAILEGNISVEDVDKDEIRFFDWNTLVPNATGQATSQGLFSDRDRILAWCDEARHQFAEELKAVASKCGALDGWTEDVWGLVDLSRADFMSRARVSDDDADKAFQAIIRVAQNATNHVKKAARHMPAAAERLEELHAQRKHKLVLLRPQDVEEVPFEWGQTNLFQQSFGEMFLKYHEAYKLNRLRELDRADGNDGADPLTPDEFQAKFGPPPWDFVNRALRDADIEFTIDCPHGYTTTAYTPRLTKNKRGEELDFQSLSSGEKTLMSFAFCLYNTDDGRQTLSRPKLLLFDEIDALLHPSMSRTVIQTIVETLTKKNGIPVIMTTHSASTVAVAPEESVYVMEPDVGGIRKTSRQHAIAQLTAGIPTLAIDFSGQRQVLTESWTDAELFDAMYRLAEGRYLDSERSLSFVGVGNQTDDDTEHETDGGCQQVRKTVREWRKAGNTRVFGLIDWDRRNDPDPPALHVLGHGERYAMENCLLDPLVLVALVAFKDRDNRVLALLDEEYKNLADLGEDRLQELVDAVEVRVQEACPFDREVRVQVEYLGAPSLWVSCAYLELPKSQLVPAVVKAFPVLTDWERKKELLGKATFVLTKDHPGLAPAVFVQTFQDLLA